MADEAAAEAPAEEGGEVANEAGAITGSEGKKTPNKNKPGKAKGAARRKGKRKRALGSIVYRYPRKPPIGPSFGPCPHIYFKHSVVRRSILNQRKYDALLATPKSEPWREPEPELQKFRMRELTPRTECLAMPPKRKLVAQLDDFARVLSPQMLDNLEILLHTECKLPVEDESAKKDKAKKIAAKKAKKEKQAKKKAALKAGKGVSPAKKGKGVSPAKRGKGAKGAVPPAEGAKTEDELEDEEEEEGQDEVGTEADTEGETEAATEGETEAATEGETEAGTEGETEGAVQAEGEGEAAAEGQDETAGEGDEEEGGEAAEGEAEAEEEELTESQLKLQETSRPLVEYAKWLEESLSRVNNWAGWIAGTVAEAQAKADKKKGTVLAKDGTPKKLTCQEWNTWKKQLQDNADNWHSTRKDILASAKMWDKFLKIRADKIKAGESFTAPNPQAYQETFGKFSSPRISKT